jgi:hypothetical protein
MRDDSAEEGDEGFSFAAIMDEFFGESMSEWTARSEERDRQLRTVDGIYALMQDGGDDKVPGPGHGAWGRAVSLLHEDLAAALLTLADNVGGAGGAREPVHWLRAAVVFTWPLVDASAQRATTSCRIRVWTSPGVPEEYRVVRYGIDENEAFTDLGVRLSALRTWDRTQPWNTYLVVIVRSGMQTWTAHDCAWWQGVPSDHFSRPKAVVEALASVLPSKGWPLAPPRTYG